MEHADEFDNYLATNLREFRYEKNHDDHTWDDDLSPHSNPSRKNNRRTGDEHHRRTERQQWIFQNEIARHGNVIAGIGVAFSIVAALGAFVAACFAGGAYHQARRQANIAQDQEVRQLRAYVYVRPDSIIYTPATPTTDGTINFEFTVLNSGDTPALNVVIYTDNSLGNTTTDTAQLPDVDPRKKITTILFKDVQEKLSGHLNLTFAWDEVFSEDGIGYFAKGTITYTDVFKKSHYTNFCYTLAGNVSGQIADCANKGSNDSN